MKTKNLTKPIFSLLLMLGALWWSGCGTSDDGPCPEENWEYNILEMSSEYDSLFPYNANLNILEYIYNDENILNELVTFELVKVDTLEITSKSWTGGGGGCSVDANRIQSFQFEGLVRGEKFMLRIYRPSTGIACCHLIREGSPHSFSDWSQKKGFNIMIDQYLSKKSQGTLTPFKIDIATYFNTVKQGFIEDYYCDDDKSFTIFNSKNGFVHIKNNCENFSFTLKK